jgi:ribosomal protein S14
LPSTWRYYPDTVVKNGERCQKCGAETGRIKDDIINVCLSCGNREYAKPVMSPAIYRLPCSLSGLDSEVDNCNPSATIVVVEADDPMSAGCVDRYLTTDGQLIDCSIDSVDFAQWFELEELEEFEGDE